MSRIRGIGVTSALLATIASTLSVYPHQLAYFNEAAGGPENGHKHLLGSNLDWGQNELIALDWVRNRGLSSSELSATGLSDLWLAGLQKDLSVREHSATASSRIPRYSVVTVNSVLSASEASMQRRDINDAEIVAYTICVFHEH